MHTVLYYFLIWRHLAQFNDHFVSTPTMVIECILSYNFSTWVTATKRPLLLVIRCSNPTHPLISSPEIRQPICFIFVYRKLNSMLLCSMIVFVSCLTRYFYSQLYQLFLMGTACCDASTAIKENDIHSKFYLEPKTNSTGDTYGERELPSQPNETPNCGNQQSIPLDQPAKIPLLPDIVMMKLASMSNAQSQLDPLIPSDIPLEMPKAIKNIGVYQGQWYKGLPHGLGKIYLEDGSYFEGQFVKGHVQGNGRYIYANGSCYEGEVLNNFAQGYGKLVAENGYVYEGEWAHDLPNGKGTQTNNTGDHYKGDYVMGKKFGNGTYRWADGSQYIGGFYDNQPNGYGKIIFKDLRSYEGNWLLGKMHGKGVFWWPNGKKYSGDYINGLKEGQGTFDWPNGKKYVGMWKKGLQHGQGKVIFNKQQETGIWHNGAKIQ